MQQEPKAANSIAQSLKFQRILMIRQSTKVSNRVDYADSSRSLTAKDVQRQNTHLRPLSSFGNNETGLWGDGDLRLVKQSANGPRQWLD